MKKPSGINEFVRKRIRRLRTAKRIPIARFLDQAGIPGSSYSDMETGTYRISLDNLFRILGVLEADIDDVWPSETIAGEALYLRRIQEFRLSEVIEFCQSRGAALFALVEGKCLVLLDRNIEEFLLERLALYIEDGIRYREGLWFRRDEEEFSLILFVRAHHCIDFVGTLIEKYMLCWSNLFREYPAALLKGRESGRGRQARSL